MTFSPTLSIRFRYRSHGLSLPTSRAALLLGIVSLLFSTGRLFGIDELLVIGIGFLVAFALAAALTPRRRVIVTQHTHPRQIHAGDVVSLYFELGGMPYPSWCTSLAVRLPEGSVERSCPQLFDRARVAYDFPTSGRGKMRLPPPQVITEDVLGLWRRIATGDEATAWILPKVETLTEMMFAQLAQGGWSRNIPTHEDEVVGVRAYVTGDDPRRIDWLHSARSDDLIVRDQASHSDEQQLEIYLDRRTSMFTDAGFEAAVSTAASLVSNALRHGIALNMHGSSMDHAITTSLAEQTALRDLAVLSRTDTNSPVSQLIMARGSSPAVVISSGRIPAQEIIELARLASRRRITLLRVEPTAAQHPTLTGALRIIDVTADNLRGTLEAL